MGILPERELLRIALLQGMGSAPQLIPQPDYRDTGSSRQSGRRCQALWQRSLCRRPSSWSLWPYVVPEPVCVGSGEGVLLSPCSRRAAGGCGSPLSWVLGWVLHTGGQMWLSLIDVKAWVRNAPGPEYLAALSNLLLESAHLIAVPLPEPDGSY